MTEAAPFYGDVADAPPGGRAFWLRASDGLRLRGAIWDGGERGTVVVLPGRTEFIEKYGRVVGRLRDRGFSVAAIDWRGQGLSQRREVAPQLGHVADFRHYQRDLDALLAHPAVAALPGRRHLLAHSMGACIGLRTLLERPDFVSAVFSAPMWRLHLRAMMRESRARAGQLAGRLMFRPPAPEAGGEDFARNALTSDPAQFAWCGAQIAAHPDLGLGGPSLLWIRAAIVEMERLRAAPPPSQPLLALAGSEECVVSLAAIRSQMARTPCGRLVELAGARHEVFMESPVIQTRAWGEIDAFLAEHAPERA